MYQKTLAKYRRHETADITSNNATLSWIVLQVFEPAAMAIISVPLQKQFHCFKYTNMSCSH